VERRLAELAAVIAASDESYYGDEEAEGCGSSCRSSHNVDRQTPYQRLPVPAVSCGDVSTVHGHEATSVDGVVQADKRGLSDVDAEDIRCLGR